MSPQWLSVLVAVMVGVIIPLVAVMMRATVKWTRVETKLNQVVSDMKEIVADKDRVHMEIITTIREDRQATDKRLRWLEENLWKRGHNRAV